MRKRILACLLAAILLCVAASALCEMNYTEADREKAFATLDKIKKCGECGEESISDSWIEEMPTCTEKGTGFYCCDACGKTIEVRIPALGHKWQKEKVKREATCAKSGKCEHTCSRCGETESYYTKKTEHDWGEWTVVWEANCQRTGKRTRTCKVCGEEQTETSDPLPHTWGDWYAVVEAMDGIVGKHAHDCTVCGVSELEEYTVSGTLRMGDSGEAVRELQKMLTDAGYPCGKADGIFGKKTEDAVKLCQKAIGKNEDGIVWPSLQHYLKYNELPEVLLQIAPETKKPEYTTQLHLDEPLRQGDTTKLVLQITNNSTIDLSNMLIRWDLLLEDGWECDHGYYRFEEDTVLHPNESVHLPFPYTLHEVEDEYSGTTFDLHLTVGSDEHAATSCDLTFTALGTENTDLTE